jgi:acyl-CoA dehydrogenase
VDYALTHSLSDAQAAFVGIYANFDGVIGSILRFFATLFLRLNPLATPPNDAMSHAAARTIQTYNAQYEHLTEGIYKPTQETPGLGRLLHAFRLMTEVTPILAKIHDAQKAKKLPKGSVEELVGRAVELKVISTAEANQVEEATKARLNAIEVDVFTPEQYYSESKGYEGIYSGKPTKSTLVQQAELQQSEVQQYESLPS